jgi:hypothetical protein
VRDAGALAGRPRFHSHQQLSMSRSSGGV